MSGLYDTDILAWSEQQSALLRRIADGERLISRHSSELDWSNIAEEIEDVGRSQLSAVRSHLVLALLHDLKAEAWPASRDVPHWRAEARMRRDEARDAFTPLMAGRKELQVGRLYRRALRGMPETEDGVAPLPVPATCPVTLDELLAEPPDAPETGRAPAA